MELRLKMEKKITAKDFKFNLTKDSRYLEYNDREIHSLLLALLDRKGIKPYKSKLVSYDEINPPKDYNFYVDGAMKLGLKQFDNHEGSTARDIQTVIFPFNEKVFVNIYPTTLPQQINGLPFYDFEYKFNEGIFELENFFQENSHFREKEVIFNIPINRGNTHWVECTIKINKNKIASGLINDPYGQPGISVEIYKELRKIIMVRLNEGIRHIGNIKSIEFDQTNDKLPNIQREFYCGGATRRLRDATIFSPKNNPYDWNEIDYDNPSKIRIDYNDSLEAREEDLKLLLTSGNKEIQSVGEKLYKKYQIYYNVLPLNKNQDFVEFFNKFVKFIPLDENVLSDYSRFEEAQDIKNEIIRLADEDFKNLFANFKERSLQEKRKIQNDWIEFCIIQEKYQKISRFPPEVEEKNKPKTCTHSESRNQFIDDLSIKTLPHATKSEVQKAMVQQDEREKNHSWPTNSSKSFASSLGRMELSEFAIYIRNVIPIKNAKTILNELDINNMVLLTHQMEPILYQKIDLLKNLIEDLQKQKQLNQIIENIFVMKETS